MYAIGILLAVLAGTAHNLGNVLQKKAVNELPRTQTGQGFYAAVLRKPLWVAGFLLQMLFGATFLLLAQLFIGPALIPGLMATGLIALTVGSILIVGERPSAMELVGIAALIAAVTLLGLSRLTIEVRQFDFFGRAFLRRTGLFTLAAAGLILALEVLCRRPAFTGARRAGIPAFSSGCLFAVSNYWTGVIVGAAVRLRQPPFAMREAVLFIIAGAVLAVTNVFGIDGIQTAFRYGKASRVVPIQQVPIQVAPVIVYLFVFGLRPPTPQSLALLAAAVVLILVSSWLLSRRGALETPP